MNDDLKKPTQASNLPPEPPPAIPIPNVEKPALPFAPGENKPPQKGESVIPTPPSDNKPPLVMTAPAPKSRVKIILTSLIILILLASVPAAIFLVQQRQEVRKQAYVGQACTVDSDCSGYPNERCDQGRCATVPTQPPTQPPAQCTKPCSGTEKSCNAATEQCVRVTDTCSQCQPRSWGAPGCCRDNNDCAHWETCEANAACTTTGKSCKSHAGCAKDSDCYSGKCVGGTCVGAGTLECHADSGGVKIVNNTDKDISGTANWYSSWCNSLTCGCSGQGKSESVTVKAKGGIWTAAIAGKGPPTQCAWQSDITFPGCDNANSGCEPGCGTATGTPTASPTGTPTTPVTAQCLQVKICNTSFHELNNVEIASLKAGDKVRFTVKGTTGANFTKARFTINGQTKPETTSKKPNSEEFYYEYTIPTGVTSFTMSAEIYHATLGWR